MLIVIMIVAIVSGISLFVMQISSQKKSLERSAEDIRNLIREAHSTAMITPDNLYNLKYIRVTVDKTAKIVKSEAIDTFGVVTPIKEVKFDVESVTLDNLLLTGATTSCDSGTSCYFDFLSSPGSAGAVRQIVGSFTTEPKFCLVNNPDANTIKKCLNVNLTTGLVEITES